jgi:hypothetical protein
MPAKKIAPAAIIALKDALTILYWYKGDLRSFLTSTLTNPALLSRLNWGDYKRNIVSELIGFLEGDWKEVDNRRRFAVPSAGCVGTQLALRRL